MSVTSGGASTLTYDLNGNMTGDGTNSYSWDACNRLIEIVYPGSGNNSQFVYDGLGRNVSILEYSGGSLTSTKQFVWAEDILRRFQPCEARNATGTITAQYFSRGEILSGTSYFYTPDHLATPTNAAARFQQLGILIPGAFFDPTPLTGSVRETTNSSGTIASQLSYDVYGRAVQLQGSISPDFQFGGYYFHTASGLSFTLTRAYSPLLGRFISRDRLAELAGNNLYVYMRNHPDLGIDPSGKCGLAALALAFGPAGQAALAALGGAASLGIGYALGKIVLGNTYVPPAPGPDCDPCNPPVFDPQINYKGCVIWCVTYCKAPGLSGCLNTCGKFLN